MKKIRENVALREIDANTGQVPWLPKNPRQWTAEDVERTRRSIVEDEDFLEDRPLLLVPFTGGFVVFAGNLRREGARKAKLKEVPAVIYIAESEEDRETVKRRAMKDNGSFGAWDFDTLANEWDDLPLTEWGVPAWERGEDEPAQAPGEKAEGRDFSCKIIFSDGDEMRAFVATHKTALEDEYHCVVKVAE